MLPILVPNPHDEFVTVCRKGMVYREFWEKVLRCLAHVGHGHFEALIIRGDLTILDRVKEKAWHNASPNLRLLALFPGG